MAYVLLLYDTLEKDLARDIKEFLIEIGVENTFFSKIPGPYNNARIANNSEQISCAFFNSPGIPKFLLTCKIT